MADRDDANLRQFKSRSQQPKILSAGPATLPSTTNPAAPVNVFIVFDSDFGSHSDQIDSTRFKYMGTSPSVSSYESMCSRRAGQACMYDSFSGRQ